MPVGVADQPWAKEAARSCDKEKYGEFSGTVKVVDRERNQEMMKKKIEKAISADDTEEGELFCDQCNKEIK